MSRIGKLSVFAATALLSTTAMLPFAQQAQAQQVYRTVGPDGKVTFSDQPPVNGSNASVSSKGKGFAPAAVTTTTNNNTPAPAAGAGGGSLPYSLQQVVNRFPVVLYTGDDCTPCASARTLLLMRGVPFTERTIGNNESLDALKALSGASTIPFGTIGAQHLQGFSDRQWTQYLDAAGYPPKSQLPPGYTRPAATPLAAAKAPAPTKTAEPASTATEPAPAPANTTPSGPTPSNPSGLVF